MTTTVPRRRHVAGVVGWLVLHLVLALGSVVLVVFHAMYVGSCGQGGCGTVDWARVGAFAVVFGGFALLAGNAVGSLWLLLARRSAQRFARALCLAQVALTLGGVSLQALAG